MENQLRLKFFNKANKLFSTAYCKIRENKCMPKYLNFGAYLADDIMIMLNKNTVQQKKKS